MREFSENILESLNDGLAVLDFGTTGSSGGIAGSRSSTAFVTREAVGRRLDEILDAGVL